MKANPLAFALIFLLASITFDSASAAESMAPTGNAWLMMVATQCTDPGREQQFNAWYDGIDIPDVLEVPGYLRARRGLRLGTPESPVSALPEDEGRYVALYDIASDDIDKTIIEMLMATRKMEARGRSTDLLKVTERVYYQRFAPPFDAPDPASHGTSEFLYVERIACCRDDASARSFNAWYNETHIPDVLKTDGFRRATRYELYRVLMIEPKEATRYLTVYELDANSTDQATMRMNRVREHLRAEAQSSGRFVENGSTLFLKIKDVSQQ